MTKVIRVGVIGVGHLGRYHAQKYAAMEHVHLVGVADIDEQRVQAVATETSTTPFTDFRRLVDAVDAVSIATPTTSHFEVGTYCLEQGVDVMMEKPITSTLEQADALVALAEERGRILQVGLVERFNPAMRAAQERLTLPLFIEAKRVSGFTRRATDVDVIIDLMIHDLDIILSLIKSPITSISAAGAPVLTPHTDIANAHLIFANGCTANITASRVSQVVERRMRLFQPGECLIIDFHGKKCSTMQLPVNDFADTVTPTISDLKVELTDALEQELLEFISCVRTRRAPVVTGSQGRDSLAVALAIIAAVKKNTQQLIHTLCAAEAGGTVLRQRLGLYCESEPN
ncbi:MAG: Gfo/Idh/MocA family protein [Desulfobulbus sp.]|jgi:predicted dehydrogenase